MASECHDLPLNADFSHSPIRSFPPLSPCIRRIISNNIQASLRTALVWPVRRLEAVERSLSLLLSFRQGEDLMSYWLRYATVRSTLHSVVCLAVLACGGVLVVPFPCSIARADTLFSWVGSNIYSQDISGGPATLVQRVDPDGNPVTAYHSRSRFGSGLEVVGERLYMLEQNGWQTRVSSMDLDGRNYQWHQNFPNNSYYSGFATDGNQAFALNTETLQTERLGLSDGAWSSQGFVLSGPGGGMDIDSTNGTLYYGREERTLAPGFVAPGFLGRSALDGSNFERHDRNIRALSIDIPNEKIYWSSGAWDELWSGDLNLAPGNEFVSNASLLATLDGDGGTEGTGWAAEMVYHADTNRLFYSAWNKPYVYALDLDDNSISKFQFTGDLGTYVNGGIAIAVTSIPEPSTLALGGISVLGILIWRFQSRCAANRPTDAN